MKKINTLIVLGLTFVSLIFIKSPVYADETAEQIDQKKVSITLIDRKTQGIATGETSHNNLVENKQKERGDPQTLSQKLEEEKKKSSYRYAYYPQTNEIQNFFLSFIGTFLLLIFFFIILKRKKGAEDEN